MQLAARARLGGDAAAVSRDYVFRDGEELRRPRHDRLGHARSAADPAPGRARARALLPRARHVPLPGCGHIPMSDDPEGVAALLLAGSA